MNNLPSPTVPAGWFPDPNNTTGYRYGGVPAMRYFDGTDWTDQVAPMPRRQRPALQPAQPVIVNQVYTYASPQVLVNRGGCNHALHAVLTLLTAGLWLPIWLLCAIFQR